MFTLDENFEFWLVLSVCEAKLFYLPIGGQVYVFHIEDLVKI